MAAATKTGEAAEPRPVRRLVFAWNASSGRLSAWADNVRKFFGVGSCALCEITHGYSGEKREWTECRQELGLEIDSVHRDELDGDLREMVGERLPAVVAQTDDGLELLLGPDALDRCPRSVDAFRELLLDQVSARGLELPPAAG